MKFAGSFAAPLALLCLWGSCATATQPMYGVHSKNPPPCAPPNSYVALAEKSRVGIYPASKSDERSSESSEEHRPAVYDHYEQARQCVDSHGRLLPVSICVQLPPEAPMKLSKGLLQRIVYSLVQDPSGAHKAGEKYGAVHEKPCEYPRKPCACAKKPHYEPPKEEYQPPTKADYEPPQHAYQPPKKVYAPATKPCGMGKESYEPPKKPYAPKGSCEEHRYGSSESYEAPSKPYAHREPKEYYAPPQEHYPAPPKPYTPPTEAYPAPTEHYPVPPKEPYHHPRPAYKEPCGATEPSYYKPTTTATTTAATYAPPYTTTHAPAAYTHPPTHRPTPYHPTATYAPYTPRYPSVSYHAPSYPKPSYDAKPPKKGCGCGESHRPYYNSSA